MIFGRTAHALLATFWPTAGTGPDASADLIEQARLMNTLTILDVDVRRVAVAIPDER